MHPAKPHLLLVDGDAKNLRVMEVTLRTKGYHVVTAVNGLDAWEKCEASVPDLVISDTRLDELDGFELCRRIKADERFVDTLFVFLSSQKTIEHKVRGLELGVDDYLTKPIYVQELSTRVKILLQKRDKERLERRDQKSGLSGSLSDMGVVDLVQTLEIGRKTGEIRLRNQKDSTAALYFREGKVVDVSLGKLEGEAAFFRLLPWTEGSFEIEFKPIDRPDRIDFSTQGLLMEGMRRMDERARLAEQLPPFGTVLVVDPVALAERLSTIPDEANPVIRLFDGRRDLNAVLEESPIDDHDTLSIAAELYRGEILRRADRLPSAAEREARATRSEAPAQRSAAAGEDFTASWFVEPTGVTELKRPSPAGAPATPPAQPTAAAKAAPAAANPAPPTSTAVSSVLLPGASVTTAARRREQPRPRSGLWFVLILLVLALVAGGYLLQSELGSEAAPVAADPVSESASF